MTSPPAVIRRVALPLDRSESSAPVLTMATHLDGDPLRLELDGDLCPYAVPFVDDELRIMRRCGASVIELDLARLDLLSSDGLSMLALHAAGMHASEGRLVVVAVSQLAHRVIEAAELSEVLPLPTRPA